MKKTLLPALALFSLNAFLCFPLFRVEFLDDFQSNESTWITFARFLMGHWPHVRWFPWYDGGMAFEATYLPLVPALTALGAWAAHASPALAFHFLAALGYSLAPVSLFLFAASVSGRTAGPFTAALMWSLFSPSVVLPTILADSGSPWVLRRLQNIVFWGETPHNFAIALVPLALLLLARYLKAPGARRFAMAALAFAAVMSVNAFGVVLLAVSAILLLISQDRPDWRHVAALGGTVAAAYLLVCRALPPSLVKRIAANSRLVGGDYRFTAKSAMVAAGCVLALGAVWWAARRLNGTMPRFSVLFLACFGGIPILSACGISLLPQPYRYHLEMEIGACLVAGFAVEAVFRRFSRRGRIAAAAVCAAPLLWVGMKDYAFARRLIRPANVANSAVYREARWVGEHFPGQRVMASSETAMWFNVFTDNPQLSGGHEPSAPNWMELVAVYTIYTGQNAGSRDAEFSVFWLKAFGCAAITVPGPASRDYYRPFRNPEKFDDVLPLVWREGGDSIYRVPLRSASLAHVIPRKAMVARQPIHGLDLDPARAYVEALDDPNLPLASLEWENPEHGRIAADVADGQDIAVQMTYDPGWQASEDGRPLRVRKDGLGLIAIEPDRTGHAIVDLRFEGGTERKTCAVIGAATGLVLLGLMAPVRWRRYPRAGWGAVQPR
jgi:hypothetical protein